VNASARITADGSPPAILAEPLSLGAIEHLIDAEEQATDDFLYLTANETILSPFAQRVLSSPLGNRYLVEHLEMRKESPSRLGNFLCRGLDRVNLIEQSATEVCRLMFGARHAEFRCLSGLHAMQTTIAALSDPGDTIMRVATKDGGHFLTELVCSRFGRKSCTYAFSRVGELDLRRTAEVFRRERPTLLYIDVMNHLFPLPLGDLKEIAGDVPLVYDASHTFGLIAGGQFQQPLAEGADILQANTHKTFFGPQKGIIVGNSTSLMERIGYVLSNGMVSSQHTASTLALFIALHEMYFDGVEYAEQVIDNARHLARRLHDHGIAIVASERGFTCNHMFLVDTRPLESSLVLLTRLLEAKIAVNRIIAFENVDGLRVGVQEVTRRGYTRDELDRIADWIANVLLGRVAPHEIGSEVTALVRSHRTIGFCGENRDPATPAAKFDTPPFISADRSNKPRWVNTHLTHGTPVGRDTEGFASVQSLGTLAATYEHQTDAAGNISFHVDGRTYVSATGAYIKKLASKDFVELTGYQNWTLTCRGCGQPSSEAYLHYLTRQQVSAAVIVHNHYIPLVELDGTDIAVISPQEYGSIELAEAVAEAAKSARLIYVRRHGLVFWGDSFDECRSALETFAALERERRDTDVFGPATKPYLPDAHGRVEVRRQAEESLP
jgi:fluorothreonine transaldolase